MRANRSRDTRPELLLRSELHRRGLRFRTCVQPVRGVRRSADLVFTRVKLAVFVDGCFWHGCADHYTAPKANADYWRTKRETNQRRDWDTDARLADAGWVALRVWEHVDATEAADLVERTYWALRGETTTALLQPVERVESTSAYELN